MRLTEKEILQNLLRAGDQYAPLKINRLEDEVPLKFGFRGYRADAIIEFSIQDRPAFEALIEIVPVPTPKNMLDKIGRLLEYISVIKDQKPDVIPMIVAPYIDSKQAKILAEKGISWLDLSGNMIVRGPNGTYIERTGKPNRYPDTAPIKKIFQGTSAIVGRALLLKPEGFSSLNEIVNFINDKNANITIPTVSKVLKILEEELLVTKSEKRIFVTNPEKLLDRLAEGYRNSNERKRRKSYRVTIKDFDEFKSGFLYEGEDDVAYGFYAAQIKGLAVTDMKTIFVKDMELFKRKYEGKLMPIISDTEFGNFIVMETNDPGVWFNASFQKNDSVVDDIELYLEMMVDTPRGPKVAEQLKKRILEKWDGASPEGAVSDG